MNNKVYVFLFILLLIGMYIWWKKRQVKASLPGGGTAVASMDDVPQ